MDNYDVLTLQEPHKQLLTKYIQFFKVKREKFIRDLKLDIEDFSSEKYNKLKNQRS